MSDFLKKVDGRVLLNDQVDFKVTGVDAQGLQKLRDDYAGPLSLRTVGAQSHRGLTITIAATHSGKITRNNTMYLPDRMRSATPTWTEHYGKPIQTHHNDESDPIGRVISARYVETTGGILDRFKSTRLQDKVYRNADEKFWTDFTSEGSFIQKLQMLKLLDSVLADPHYQGTGFVELTALITDQSAVEKILDNRYLTGSIGASSDKAICSVCSTNWLEEEWCGHQPGKTYEGKKAYLIAGNIEYNEWSFVNTPADRHSTILSILNSAQETEIKDSANLNLVPISFGLNDKEDSAMKNVEADSQEDKETPSIEVQDEVGGAANTSKESLDSEVIDSTKDDTDVGSEKETEEEVVSLLAKLLADETLDEKDAYALYLELGVEDAISEENYKKLPRSCFVGPARTFPVVDELHYQAISKYLTDNAVEHSSILGNLQRKGKALGFSDKTETLVEETLVTEDTTELEDPVEVSAAQITSLLDIVVSEHGVEVKDKALEKAGLLLPVETEQALCDEVSTREDLIVELRDQLSALRREFSATLTDMADIEDRLVNTTSELHSAKAERLYDMKVLSGATAGAELREECLALSDSALSSELSVTTEKFDIKKIADKFNDGLTRTPEEILDNPVPAAASEHSTADASVDTEIMFKPTYATQKMVDQTYHNFFVVQQNPTKAKMYYTEMVKKGLAKSDPNKMLNLAEDKEE